MIKAGPPMYGRPPYGGGIYGGSAPYYVGHPPYQRPPFNSAGPPPLSSPLSTPSPQNASSTQLYAHKPPPFDPFLCEQYFPKNTTEAEESALTQLLLKRHQEISPTTQEQNTVSTLVSKVKAVLDKIIVMPDSFTAMGIEEVREVGSYKKGTMIAQCNVADIAVILKTLPTVESVNALGQKIVKDLKENGRTETFGFVGREFGCEIAGTQAVVRLLITILPHQAKLLEPDLHLPEKVMQANMATIRHARWFEEHATHTSIKVLIRLIKYARNRFDGLKALNVWCVEILAHYCVMNTPSRTPLPLCLAFRRFFQMLSVGIFLPNSSGLIDPCENQTRVHFSLEPQDMDTICNTAQTLLRIILHGRTDEVIGDRPTTIVNDVSVWGNVVVSPLERAYNATDMEPYFGDLAGEEKADEPMQ